MPPLTDPAPPAGGAPGGPRFGDLLATGTGTAMASVCIIGLVQIQELARGVWAVAAILLAGALCFLLARIFERLMRVVPSGAGLFAYVSRGMGRRAGLMLALPYVGMSLLLAGFEALVVGFLVQELLGFPQLAGGALFLVASWAICRADIRIGYRAQAVATWALVAGLLGFSLLLLGDLAARGALNLLVPEAPHPAAFAAAVGQGLFLFMGFELLTSHVEVAAKERIGRALRASVGMLTLFYGGVALGLSAIQAEPAPPGSFVVPQLLISDQFDWAAVPVAVTLICVLASFTSFNGGLLGLSRLIYVLGSLGVLPRALARIEPGRRTARPALALLLVLALAAMLLVHGLALHSAAILAAAASAALVYAAATWTRETGPFREPDRPRRARHAALLLAGTLVLLAVGVVAGAGPAQPAVIALLVCMYAGAFLFARHAGRMTGPARAAAAGGRAWRPSDQPRCEDTEGRYRLPVSGSQ